MNNFAYLSDEITIEGISEIFGKVYKGILLRIFGIDKTLFDLL